MKTNVDLSPIWFLSKIHCIKVKIFPIITQTIIQTNKQTKSSISLNMTQVSIILFEVGDCPEQMSSI